MRSGKVIVAVAAVAMMLVASAAPAGATDDSFKGRYYATWTTIHGTCDNVEHAVWIRYLGEDSRRYDPAGSDRGSVLRYRSGERLPWQFTGQDGGIALRYREFTDYARGRAWEAECTWRVFIGRSDAPSD